VELVNLALERCKLYGHDQIQLNNLFSRSSLIWDQPPSALNGTSGSLSAIVPWFHQQHPDYNLFNKSDEDTIVHDWASHKQAVEDELARVSGSTKINVLLLHRLSALRYCNQPKKSDIDWIAFLKPVDMLPSEFQQVVALHCFVDTGPAGEQGLRKREMKKDIALALNYWVLKEGWAGSSYIRKRNASDVGDILNPRESCFNQPDCFNELIDTQLLETTRQIWVHGNISAQRNPFYLTLSDRRKKRIEMAAHFNATKLQIRSHKKKRSKKSKHAIAVA
jgi:hypothetical protein